MRPRTDTGIPPQKDRADCITVFKRFSAFRLGRLVQHRQNYITANCFDSQREPFSHLTVGGRQQLGYDDRKNFWEKQNSVNILTESSAKALLEATEINYAEFYRLYTNVPKIQHHDEPGVLRLSSEQPADYLNTVLRTMFDNGTASNRIQKIMAEYKSQRVSVRWHVWPNSRPADLSAQLDGLGLRHTRNIPCMALDLATIILPEAGVNGLEITLADDLPSLYEWMTPVAYDLFFCLAYEMGLPDTSPVLHFLARYKGEPAATASIYLGAGVAGLYDVATMPEVRERGIGTALCARALQTVRNMGYRYAVLQSSKMGYRIYQRLGFQQIGYLVHFNWYDFYEDY